MVDFNKKFAIYKESVGIALIFIVTHFVVQVCGGYFLSPELQICDTYRLRRFKKGFCPNKLVFASNFTKVNSDCLCLSGIWAILSRDCVSSLIVSRGGCLASPQIKAMQYLGTFGKDDFFSVISTSANEITYSLRRPIHNSHVSGTVWVFNGQVAESSDGVFCAERSPSSSKAARMKIVKKYKIHGRLTVQEECAANYSSGVTPELEYGLLSRESSECKLDCNKKSATKLLLRKSRALQSTHPNQVSNGIFGEILGTFGIRYKRVKLKEKKKNGTTTTRKGKSMNPKKVERLLAFLNTRLLQQIVNLQFPNKKLELKAEYIPQGSFQILEMLQNITLKVCSSRIPARFLELAHILFRTVYERTGSELMETLTVEETNSIMQILTNCHSTLEPLEFEEMCSVDEAITFVKKTGEFVQVNISHSPKDSSRSKYHLTPEIPWNMIDLTVAVCIDAFSQSYILYHKMEQALEKLFTKDLQILWKSPKTAEFYKRLYGPHWKHYGESLENCVAAAYHRNPKMSRLRRLVTYPLRRKGTLEHIKSYQIPGITLPHTFAGNSNIRSSANTIVASAHLTCQSFDLSNCEESKQKRSLW